jgi:integrase
LNACIVGYYQSLGFRELAPGTQVQRRAIYERLRVRYGDCRIATLPATFITGMLARLKPHARKNWLYAIRVLMAFAIAEGFRTTDPTAGIKVKTPKSDGYHTWTEDEIAQYEAKHPIGSMARLAFALLLYTVQRSGDVLALGPQHVRNRVIHFVGQQKTGIPPFTIPIHPNLQAVLDATPCQHLTYLVTASGEAYRRSSRFSQQFRTWCDEAGLPECTAHGLRKAGARRLAEAGCTVHQIAAITGHKTLSEVQRYTRAADQARLAREAMDLELRTKRVAEVANLDPGFAKK